jgi:hypothetical protein
VGMGFVGVRVGSVELPGVLGSGDLLVWDLIRVQPTAVALSTIMITATVAKSCFLRGTILRSASNRVRYLCAPSS